MHLEELQDKHVRCRRNKTYLWKNHGERFTQWVKENVYDQLQIHILWFILPNTLFEASSFFLSFFVTRSQVTQKIIRRS